MHVAAASRRPRSKRRHAAIRLLAAILAGTALAAGGPAYALKGDADQPINIHAHSVTANQKTGVSVYRGNVVMTQGSLRIDADRLEVRLRNGRTDLIRAWGNPARMRARTDAGDDVRAKAARLEYHARERRIDLYDNVDIRRGEDVFTGAVAHYQLDDQAFTAQGGDGGQVSAVIQPPKKEAAR